MKKVKKVVAILKLNQKSNKKSLFIFFILGFFTEIINIMNVFLPAMFVQFLIDNKSKKFIAILLISMAILISISSFIVSILKLKIIFIISNIQTKIVVFIIIFLISFLSLILVHFTAKNIPIAVHIIKEKC